MTRAGRVLPIGGVKQTLLAAHRAGLTEIIIPARNEPDLDEVPAGGADVSPIGGRPGRTRVGVHDEQERR